VNQIHVEAIGLEPQQTFIDLLKDVPSRETAIVGSRPDGIEHLRAQEQLLPHCRAFRFQPAADVALAAAAAIGVGRIEKVDPGVDRAIHQVERLRLGFAHPEKGGRRTDTAEVAAAESQARHAKAGRSQPSIVHRT